MRRFIFSIVFFVSLSFLQAQEITYTWNGSVDTNWTTPGNWTRSSPIGSQIPTGNSKVVIKETSTNNYPKLESGINALAKKVTVEAGAKLDIGEFYIKNNNGNPCDINLSGTLLLKGTSIQSTWFESSQPPGNGKITLNDDCTVSYYDSAYNTSNIWGGAYKNLSTTRSLKAGFIEVEKTFSIEGSAPITIEANYHKYKGDVRTSCATTFKSIDPDGLSVLGKMDGMGANITFECSKIDVAGEIKAANLEILGASTKWTSLNNITVSGNVLANSIMWKATGGNITVGGNLEGDKLEQTLGKVILNGNGAQSIKVKKIKEFEVSPTSHATWQGTGGEQTIEKATNGGSLTIALSADDLKIQELYNSGTLENAGTLVVEKLENTVGTFTVKTSATLSVKNLENTSTFNTEAGATISIESLINETGATFNASSAITLSKKLINKGNFTSSTLELTPSENEIVIEGGNNASNTNLGDVVLENATGKILTFKEHITIGAGTKLSGLDEDNLLTIQGEGTLYLAAPITNKAKYLAVKTNIPVEGGAYATEHSKPIGNDDDIKNGQPNNWIFEKGLLPIIWKGISSTQWNLDINWIPRGLPTQDSDVSIPQGCNNYPVLSNDENAKSVVVEANAELDLSGFILQRNMSTSKIELSGLLKMKGVASQKSWLEESDSEKNITHQDNSTIEYYDAGGDIWEGPYENLITSRSINAESVEVKKNFTIEDTSPPTGTLLTVNVKNQKYIGNVIIKRDTSFEAEMQAQFEKIEAINKNVYFKASNVVVAKEVKSSNLKLEKHPSNSTEGVFSFLDKITLSGAGASDGKLEANIKELSTKDILEANNIIINEGEWISEGSVKVVENISLSGANTKWSSQEDVEVFGNITASGIEWIATQGNITVKGNVVADKLQQNLGKIILNGNGAQSIKAKKIKELEVSSTSQATWQGIGDEQTIEKATNEGSLTIDSSALDLKIKNLFNSSTMMIENATLSIENLENTAGSFSTQAGAVISIASLINKAGANFNVSSTITLSEKLTNKGNLVIPTLILNPEGNSIIIEGISDASKTKITTFVLENAASKELIIKESITVENSLKLSGAGESQELTIKGEGKISLTNPVADEGQYLIVHTNIPIEGANKYTTKRSRPEGNISDIDAGKPENWIFDDSSGTIRWHGGISDNWNEIRNWRPQGLPSEKTDILIPAGRTNYPLLKAGDAPKGQKLTIENAALLDLDIFVIETSSSTTKIVNNGTLKLKGTSVQKMWFEEPDSAHNISIGEDSLVQYYGNLQDDIWGGAYKNLITSRSLHSASLIVEKTFTIMPNSINHLAPIVIEANTQNYRSDVNILSPSIFKGTGHGIFKKILATGQDINFEMQDVRVEGNLNANNLSLSNVTTNSSFIAKGNIILSNALTSNVSQLKTEKKIEAKSITTSSAKWTSHGDIKVLQNINTTTTSWQAVDGIIIANANVLASGLVQRSGKLILKSASPQKLIAKKIEVLEIENEAASGVVELSLDTISTFLLKKGNALLLKDASFIKEFTNTQGTFDAVFHKAIVNIEPIDTFILQAKANITDNLAETGSTGNKFYKLHCKRAGGKTLKIEGAIEVLYDISGEPGYIPPTSSSFSQDSSSLILEGSSASKLNIIGNGQIWFNKTPPFPKAKKGGKFLHVASTVEIRGGYYRVKGGTYNMPAPRGWLFEEYAKILASLAITGSNEVYVVFNTPVARPPDNSLKITAPSFADMTSIGVLPYPKGSSAHKSDKWIYKFASNFTPLLLLEKNALLSMGSSDSDFIFESPNSDEYPHKRGYISDIGLNLLENILAKNTKKINIFDGSKQLPFVNTSLLIDIPVDSNITLHVAPTSNSKYWVPTGLGANISGLSIDPSPSFSMSISPDAGLSNAQTKAFIVSSTVPQFKKSMGVEFMFSYDGLPCARLQNKDNIFSFALWKFGFISTFAQRGGVSIFNNVINPNKGQETTIEVTIKKAGVLTIEVMTIDGSIVKTIVSEYKGAGTYNYFWGGFNSSGGMVGRGFYFVRIVGGGIDEVRKVLVVRN